MSAAIVIAVGLLGGAGAVGRVLLDGAVSRRLGRRFPYGTLAVNISGSLVLGLLVGAGLGADADRLLGTGLLGAYTTFSTWMLDSHRLADDRQPGRGALNIVLSLALGIGAVWLGRRIGMAF